MYDPNYNYDDEYGDESENMETDDDDAEYVSYMLLTSQCHLHTSSMSCDISHITDI